MTAHTLCINAGSSSVKYALFNEEREQIDSFSDNFDSAINSKQLYASAEQSLQHALDQFNLNSDLPLLPTVCAHRFVFGGSQFSSAALIDEKALQDLEQLSKFAPLHMPQALAFLKAVCQRFPEAKMTAHFDNAFHHTIPTVNQMFALPTHYYHAGLRRFGFHGLSYAYICQQLASLSPVANGRWVIAHLGSGASLCGLKGGQSQICTMGFSPLDGLPMASRSGQIDPGAIIHLLRNHNHNADSLEHLLYKQSGLLALSEQTGDWQLLSEQSDHQAQLAKTYFIEQVVQHIGKVTAHLQGIDGIVFTGGIGQNDRGCVEAIIEKLKWLGITQPHESISDLAQPPIKLSSSEAKVEAWIIATDEAAIMAQEADLLIQATL